MADVFLARDQLLDRPVAVKVLFPQFASEPAFVERFRLEAQAAANLNHPSIVSVYDWGEHDNTYFIVMEYVEGQSLAEVIRAEGSLEPDRAAEIATDVASALGFAHRNGVVHRDVKGGNILVTPDGQIKVTDFGIARAFGGSSELTETGSVMGTATYFSPEQAQGKNVDPRSDLYSLGVVLFEMVTGRPPFVGESPVAIAYKHVQEAPPRPRSLNPELTVELERLIARLLAKNPADRYPSAEEVRADLRRFREGEPVLAVTGAVSGEAMSGSTDTAQPTSGSVGSDTSPPSDASATTALPAVDAGASAAVGTGVIDTSRAVPASTAAGDPYRNDPYEEPPRRNTGFIVALVVLLLALGGLVWYITSLLSENSETTPGSISVPDVIGQTKEDAERLLTEAKLVPNTTFEEHGEAEADTVFEQDPGPAVTVDEGSVVSIKVARAGETVLLEDVRGRPEDEARAILVEANLRVDIRREASDEFDVGIVFEQNPPPGEEVNADTLVSLTVSTGPAEVVVPSLAGLTVPEASTELGQQNLPSPKVILEPSSTVEKGRVIRSDPPAGTPVSVDRQVDLYVSEGPATALVPPVIGLTQAAAEQAILNKSFTPSVEFVDVPAGSSDDGKVVSQDPAANQRLEEGSTVVIRIGQAAPETTTTTAATTTTTATTVATTTTTVASSADGGDG